MSELTIDPAIHLKRSQNQLKQEKEKLHRRRALEIRNALAKLHVIWYIYISIK